MLVATTAADFLRYTTWAIFLLIGMWTVGQALRRPTAVNVDTALLFGCLALVIVVSLLVRLKLLETNSFVQWLISAVVCALPFLLVRLMDDVIGVSRRALRSATVAFVLIAIILALPAGARPPALLLLIVAVLVGMLISVVAIGLRAIRRTRGVTRRRLVVATLGTLFLALNFTAGSLPSFLPISADDARSMVDLSGVAAGLCYLVGFAPPRWLRRIWQGAELRAFLQRVTRLSLIGDPDTVLVELEQGAAAALGAPQASIGIYDEVSQTLRFTTIAPSVALGYDSPMPAARAFRLQRALFSDNTMFSGTGQENSQYRDIARAILAAPVSIGARRLGVLTVYAPRAPIFADADLELIQLLADQVAIVLESRRLNMKAAEVRAREQATRLKEDFLSTAAHDLKTPLTSIILQAQQLMRRAERNPDAPVNPAGLARMVRESEHLRALVFELLDAARAERGMLVGDRAPLDLAAALRDAVQRHENGRHRFAVMAPETLVGDYDAQRMVQVLDNLIENSIKYSPDGGLIAIQLWQDAEGVHLTVRDQGIGIPTDDLPRLFERFHRGTNIDDRRFPGWGLGLSICRQIIEQHGGRIAVDSKVGAGTTFHVYLPGVL